MGILRAVDDSRFLSLGLRQMVGRAEHCDICVPERTISGEHALLSWADGRWRLRDLGSRNGTLVGGQALPAGRTALLRMGDRITFGRNRTFELVDEGPVGPAARHEDGRLVVARDGMLGEEEEPGFTCYAADQGWVIERGDEVRLVAGDTVPAPGWTLLLPPLAQALSSTADATRYREQGPELRFRVSSDEEYVELTLLQAEQEKKVRSRAHHYLLLTLARQRLAERAEGDRSEAECGWMHVEELCRGLRLDPERLNVDIYRARRQLGGAGLPNPSSLIERRVGFRQLRIGVERLTVEGM